MSDTIEIVSWDPIAIWSYNTPHTNCAICKNTLTQKCATCFESKNILNEECKVSKGKCGHVYHYHCISNWIRTANSCPIDATPWGMEQENMGLSTIYQMNINKVFN
ncbi:Hypothetical protein KVN_LOCUS163 [uncultured virus]|nr:Hypothetical protein KVN_LOCUS163 [uncultured virus]